MCTAMHVDSMKVLWLILLLSTAAPGKEKKQINLYDHSTEGTSVNGNMLMSNGKRPKIVKLGDKIKFGEFLMGIGCFASTV